MGITDALTLARARSGVPLTGLSARTGIAVSNLSAIEHGRRNPTASVIDRILTGAGLKALVYDTRGRATVAEIAAGRAAGTDGGGFRALVQASDTLRAVSGLDRLLLALQEPVSVAAEWDAALAGVTELRLMEEHLPFPQWVSDRGGDEAWAWSPDYGVASTHYRVALDDVPAPLRRRGILIEASELESA